MGWTMCARLLFITPHVGSESTSDILEKLNEIMLKTTGIDLKAFENPVTFVTDCASVGQKVFSASISLQNIAYIHLWVGFISHQLNNVMKSGMESGFIKTFQTF